MYCNWIKYIFIYFQAVLWNFPLKQNTQSTLSPNLPGVCFSTWDTHTVLCCSSHLPCQGLPQALAAPVQPNKQQALHKPLSATAHGCFGLAASISSLSIPSPQAAHRDQSLAQEPRGGRIISLTTLESQNVEFSSTKPPETKCVNSAVFISITQFFAMAVTWLFST